MRISACFPTLPKLNSGKSKKSFFLKKKKLSDISKTSASFSMKDLTISWETIYSIPPRKLNKILWKSFLMNKRKDSMQSLKQNLTQFLWNTLLYCLCNKTKIWACCYGKAWIAWLCWAWVFWFCIMSWLCCHSRAFLSLFCSCKSSDLNSRSCSSFSRR